MKKETPPPESSKESAPQTERPESGAANLFRRVAGKVGLHRRLDGLHGSDAALVAVAIGQSAPAIRFWVCRNNREAEQIVTDLRYFTPPQERDAILLIPGFEASPYRGLSPHPEIAEMRAVNLWRLLHMRAGTVVTTLHSLLSKLPSPTNFLSGCLRLEVTGFFPMDHLLALLRESGYLKEDPVGSVGEYSNRGGIVDIFSPAHANPLRVEFFGDEIESIREFDPSNQRSISMVPHCDLVPMREMVISNREIARWQDAAADHWNQVRFAEVLQEKLQFTSNGELFNGFEYLFPLILGNNSSLLDYLLAEDATPVEFFLPQPTEFFKSLAQFLQTQEEQFADADQAGDLALPPDKLFFSGRQIRDQFERHPVYQIRDLSPEGDAAVHFDFRPEPKYRGRIQELLMDIEQWRREGERVILAMSSLGMAERLRDVFAEYESYLQFAPGGFSEAAGLALSVTEGRLSDGFHSPEFRLHVLSQENVFEESATKPAHRKPAKRELSGAFLSDFRDLKDGDFVVHIEHGIGLFRGLKRIGVGEAEREFVELVYQNEAKLYVPIDRLDLLQKFSGAGMSSPPLDRLGGVSWERTKKRIRKSVRELAEDLLALYARREVAKGHAFSPDGELMKEFEDAFEFEVTPDQRHAIEDVKRDMERERPMDRLICGDVGYGKTEVAMRAAFKAINDNLQVAVLAPTTVLAYQHFNTFRERFQGFPVTVEMISRFRSRQEQAEILEKASLGLVDILIGTHRLLSKDVKFDRLGLIVVDEEQRFGVAQKEKLKRIKTQVDVLTLSATPIPRTLNMSLIGVRDLSIIETPPKDRLSIQTVVVKFSQNIVRSAIDLEMKRSGQVFFVHNAVETIYSIAEMVQQTVPEARVGVAHGQMRERQLEEVMLDFLNYRFDVLVCTTIIENGLDIPRANTLIVNRADHFGLSQLYQLRGRVGRSNRRAYAFLLIPSEETLTEQARKRLQAIREFSDLGAGFRIAALDLEIRGTGNLLGSEQHGHINSIGLDLYMKLLEQTIRELKGEDPLDEIQPSIDLRLEIQVPEHYISDSSLRLWLYKRVSSVPDLEKLENLRAETVDRFGKYPRSVSNLFEYAIVRLRARRLKILNIERRSGIIKFKFRPDTPVQPQDLISLIHRDRRFSLAPDGVLSFAFGGSEGELFPTLREILDRLQAP